MASIAKRPDGRWRARYKAPDGRWRAQHFDRKADATAFLDGIASQVVTGTYVAPERGKLTVAEWADKWIAGKVSLKPSTRATYKSILKHHVKPRWERVALADVAHEDIAEWIGDLRAGGLSASRTRQVHTVFAAMLDAAVRSRRLPSNPARGVELPRLPALKHRYLTHGEVAALADECGGVHDPDPGPGLRWAPVR
jgi:site-specific recombinase XerD